MESRETVPAMEPGGDPDGKQMRGGMDGLEWLCVMSAAMALRGGEGH